jgi:hypothetical protein
MNGNESDDTTIFAQHFCALRNAAHERRGAKLRGRSRGTGTSSPVLDTESQNR